MIDTIEMNIPTELLGECYDLYETYATDSKNMLHHAFTNINTDKLAKNQLGWSPSKLKTILSQNKNNLNQYDASDLIKLLELSLKMQVVEFHEAQDALFYTKLSSGIII